MKKFIFLLTITFSSVLVFSQQLDKLNTKAYDWNEMPVKKTKTGEKRHIFKGHTKTLSYFSVHVTTLNPGVEPHGSVMRPDMEELIIVKEGKVSHRINKETKILGPGSVILASPGDDHEISNAGDTPVSYFMLRWKTDIPADMDRSAKAGGSGFYDWNDIEYRETKKGGVRSFLRRPTALLSELEMHVTTLNESITSHSEHIHDAEEIILVINGEVEESIDGTPHRLGPGSLILLMDGVSHGIKNVGKGQCEYFAFKWLNETD